MFDKGFLGGLTVIKFGIKGIEILAVQSVLNNSKRLSEPLEMDNLSCPEELNWLDNIRAIYKLQYICNRWFMPFVLRQDPPPDLLLHILLRQSRAQRKEIPQQTAHICRPYGQRSNLQIQLPLSVRQPYL